MTPISNAVAETADVRDIMALEPSSRENAATPTALDFASPVSEGKDPSPRELLAPEASPPADDASDGGATPPEADSPDGSAAAAAAGDGMSEEERQSIELAMRLQAEEEARMEEEADALERMQGMPASTEDEESLRLAIQLQQEEDDATLRRFLGEHRGHLVVDLVVDLGVGLGVGLRGEGGGEVDHRARRGGALAPRGPGRGLGQYHRGRRGRREPPGAARGRGGERPEDHRRGALGPGAAGRARRGGNPFRFWFAEL